MWITGAPSLTHLTTCRKDTVQSQRYQLEDLDAKLREADARLQHLEANATQGHRRHQSHAVASTTTSPHLYQSRKPVASVPRRDHDAEDDSSGDSDAQGRSSPQQAEER
jgi:uncharacterized protein YdaU (DUF1376 family)